jgi:hypothetical protein
MSLSKKHRTKHKSYKKYTKKRIHHYKSRTTKRMRLRKQKGGGIGNDLRTQLVNLCKEGNWEEYDRVTDHIIDEYIRGKNDFLIYLDKEMFLKSERDTHKKYKKPGGFSRDTILCLERCLTRLQEEAIPESMVHLTTAVNVRNSINH